MEQRDEYSLTPGTLLGDRYQVMRPLGTGSMGVVYLCRDTKAANREVAIKVLFLEMSSDEAVVERFKNEIAAAHEVVHRNVVQPFDYFRDGGLHAYTMEYVRGSDLSKIMQEAQLLLIPETVNILTQVCRGVAAIHRSSIVHRDLKPENVMLSESGDVKIMDFGIARTGTGRKLTARGSILGTFEYMSPEYLSDAVVHTLGDIYSIGVIGYELITGQLPHRGENLIAVIKAKVHSDPDHPQHLRPECPAELANIVLKALSRDVGQRYQSAAGMCSDLMSLGMFDDGNYEGTLELAPNLSPKSSSESLPLYSERDEAILPPVSTRPNDALSGSNIRSWEDEEPVPRGSFIGSTYSPATAATRDVSILSKWKGKTLMTIVAILIVFSLCAVVGTMIHLSPAAPTQSGDLIVFSEGEPSHQKTQTGSSIEEPISLKFNQPASKAKPTLKTKLQTAGLKGFQRDLFSAVYDCDFEQVERALGNVEKADIRDKSGNTPLSWAARNNCLAIANLLIDRGANVNAITEQGLTPYQWADLYKHREIKKLLVASGARSKN